MQNGSLELLCSRCPPLRPQGPSVHQSPDRIRPPPPCPQRDLPSRCQQGGGGPAPDSSPPQCPASVPVEAPSFSRTTGQRGTCSMSTFPTPQAALEGRLPPSFQAHPQRGESHLLWTKSRQLVLTGRSRSLGWASPAAGVAWSEGPPGKAPVRLLPA